MIDDFNFIEKYKPKDNETYTKPPSFGEVFIYRNNNKFCYRAFRLNSNTENNIDIRAFLPDIGQMICCRFKPGRFFKMTNSLMIDSDTMGIFCCLDTYDTIDSNALTKSQFLKRSVGKTFKFNVLSKTLRKNHLGDYEHCLLVEIEKLDEKNDPENDDNDEDLETIQEEEFNLEPKREESVKDFSRLHYLDYEKKVHIPFMAEKVQHMNLPQPGSKVLIAIGAEIVSPKEFYANCLQRSDCVYKQSSDFGELMLRMNKKQAVASYQRLPVLPLVNEMIVAKGKYGKFHRGLVKEICDKTFIVSCIDDESNVATLSSNSSPQIYFVDFGYDLPLRADKLHKFPLLFAQLPFQAYFITIDNITICQYPDAKIRAMSMLKQKLSKMTIAHVM